VVEPRDAQCSPRVWGWSGRAMESGNTGGVLPTRVGMVRLSSLRRGCSRCSPHACGDGPPSVAPPRRERRFSPRVWGWSGCHHYAAAAHGVLPTRVGMVRNRARLIPSPRRSPHACGDGPYCLANSLFLSAFSPRVWGWSVDVLHAHVGLGVLPTRVGMVRVSRETFIPTGRSPHACGDGPLTEIAKAKVPEFSPRVWGWSVAVALTVITGTVLPTRVGMVRRWMLSGLLYFRSPHACGDGPPSESRDWPVGLFSPRVWGWSGTYPGWILGVHVLPTRVGMVRNTAAMPMRTWRSPHACGDGPNIRSLSLTATSFSPRVWGWSVFDGGGSGRRDVLPTRVG